MTDRVQNGLDDFVVRLDRPDRGADEARPNEAPWDRRRHRRLRRRVVVLVLLLLAVLAREPIMGLAEGVFEHLVDDVTAVEDGLSGATRALNHVYEERGSYEATLQELQTFGPKVDWLDEIRTRTCLGGQAVVVVGDVGTPYSRLLVRGADWGQVVGDRECPRNLSDPRPWPGPSPSS